MFYLENFKVNVSWKKFCNNTHGTEQESLENAMKTYCFTFLLKSWTCMQTTVWELLLLESWSSQASFPSMKLLKSNDFSIFFWRTPKAWEVGQFSHSCIITTNSSSIKIHYKWLFKKKRTFSTGTRCSDCFKFLLCKANFKKSVI